MIRGFTFMKMVIYEKLVIYIIKEIKERELVKSKIR